VGLATRATARPRAAARSARSRAQLAQGRRSRARAAKPGRGRPGFGGVRPPLAGEDKGEFSL